MALNQLSEKLDTLDSKDIGIDFDEARVWNRLNERLSSRRYPYYWWMAAASLFLLTLLPITILKETQPVINVYDKSAVVKSKIQEPIHEIQEEPLELNTHIVPVITPRLRKHAELKAAVISNPNLTLVPIELSEPSKEQVVFNQNDISIIQASLESPTIENGRKVTIRAQWQKSPNEVPVNYQALKIKLYEKDE
ncbi:hypothetical protein [Ekhidna sp.]|uniref:hypothetical protein n=1 Tax=Ekhidna sp. TaxID=2608089 RepID=UPI003CCC328E